MKKCFLIAIGVFVFGLGVLIYFKVNISKQTATSKLIYNFSTQKWEKYNYEDPVEADREVNI